MSTSAARSSTWERSATQTRSSCSWERGRLSPRSTGTDPSADDDRGDGVWDAGVLPTLSPAPCPRSSSTSDGRGRRQLPRRRGREVSSNFADSLDPVVIRKEVEARFSPEIMVANYVASYEATIEATRRQAPPVPPRDRPASRFRRWARSRRSPLPPRRHRDRGHLGRPQLAALGIAFTILGGTFAMFNFLQYGTTVQRWRVRADAGEEETARRLGAQAVWLSIAFGVARLGAARDARRAARVADGRRGGGCGVRRDVPAHRGDRIPGGVLARAGLSPWCRGPAHAARDPHRRQRGERRSSRCCSSTCFDWRVEASAWGTAIAQLAGGRRSWWSCSGGCRAGRGRAYGSDSRGGCCRWGSGSSSRTTAPRSRSSSPAPSPRVRRRVDFAAHQIAFQLWIFLALVLDAVAIAGQIIVGRELGAGRARTPTARAQRMIWLSVALGGCSRCSCSPSPASSPRVFHGRRVRARRGGAPVADLRAHAAAERCRLRPRRDPHRRERRAVPRAVDGRRVPRRALRCSC